MILRDFDRILTRFYPEFNRIPWNLVKNCLAPSSADPIYPVPTKHGLCQIHTVCATPTFSSLSISLARPRSAGIIDSQKVRKATLKVLCFYVVRSSLGFSVLFPWQDPLQIPPQHPSPLRVALSLPKRANSVSGPNKRGLWGRLFGAVLLRIGGAEMTTILSDNNSRIFTAP